MVAFKLVFILCVVSVCLANYSNESRDPISKAFQTLKDEEKEDFLSYFLALGLNDWVETQPRPPKFISNGKRGGLIKGLNIAKENIQKFQKLDIPKESRLKLLEWTKTEFNLSTTNVVDLIKTRKCQGPECVSLPDIGEICCPW